VGHAGLGQFFQTLGERATKMDLDIHDITTSPEHVVSIVTHHHDRGERKLDMPATHIWHIHDGKVMEMWELVRDTGVWDEFWAA
jgi:predicted SnoaL-like aldol condensation-catalyzing enzyme